MTEQPPITWLLSTKNSMPYLTATLESIAAQTYSNHKVLVWDDCSNDGSLEELERWIPQRIPGRIFAGQSKRLGPSLAFLLDKADTELCARIDGDDVNLPTRLERQVEVMLRRPQLGILGSYIEIIDAEGKRVDEWHYPTNDADVRWLMRYSTQVAHPAVMFRRSSIQAAGGYRDFFVEDSDLWIRACRVTEISNVPEVLLQYRRTETSATGTVIDWLPSLRRVAEHNVNTLFPGLDDPKRVMELWEATHPNCEKPVKLRHLTELKAAAVRAAQQAGMPDDYFTNAEAFRAQYFHVRRRALNQIGLAPLLQLRDRLSGIRRSR